MPTPTWLSRLELDLVKARKKQKRKRRKKIEKVEVEEEEKEEQIGGTEPFTSSSDIASTDAAATSSTGATAVEITGTGTTTTTTATTATATTAATTATTAATTATTTLLSTAKDPQFDRVHLHSARLGELLVPVRIARTESEPLFGPKSPTNRHLRKVLGSSSAQGTISSEQVARALKETPYPLSRDVILSPKKWKVAHNDVEPVGWYNPFADRFPNQINVGKGRDFTRVPAKFPGGFCLYF